MKELLEPTQDPPGGWRWTHPETGQKIHGGNYSDLCGLVRQFLGNNSFPIPLDLNQRILEDLNDEIQRDMIARGLPAYPFLKDTQPPSIVERVAKFGHAAAQWAKQGFHVVSQEKLEAREAICHVCPHWNGSSYYGLGSCSFCGCSGLKLYVETEKCPLTPPKW